VCPHRILFVDDEPNILEGLSYRLRKKRRSWDLLFASDGPTALLELARQPVDVIVCDMRMPGMDGATLLKEVKEHHPSVIRIVLSGYAEREAVVRTLPVAHQFLSKPCDGDTLQATLEWACQLHELLGDVTIRRAIGRLDRLPSVPHTYLELTQAVAAPGSSAAQVARIIETDPAMSIKVLQLANSAYFGAAQRKVSVSAAVAYLGVELLKGLALTSQVFAALESAPVEGFSIEALQERSLRTARLARRLVGDRDRAEEAFTAGLIRDIGRVILALGQPDRYGLVVKEALASGRPFQEVEAEHLGVTHSQVGAYLLGMWGLPLSIVEVVAFHHAPGAAAFSRSHEVLAAVHVAGVLVDQAAGGAGSRGDVDRSFLAQAGFDGALEPWRAMAKGFLDRAGSTDTFGPAGGG
jgi:HD-like signal output (HDOD) protein/ActR/RegA family two-component response regulator